ncbi:MAG: hisA [Oscillospiraceae bacterium]|nr:hisA [Oscillospiraceae bacterium]
MILLPAIDLKDSKVVRLYKGSFDTVHQVAGDAGETAAGFVKAGAKWLHTVDLDGARNGVRLNFGTVRKLAETSGLQVEMGGGVKTEADVDAVAEAGVSRIVIGSAAVTHPEVVEYAVRNYPDRIAVGLDTLDGKVRTAGWEHDSGLDYLELATSMERIGVRYLIFTDIATDGMLSGPSYDRLEALKQRVSCHIIASGGVTYLEDIKKLRDMGLYGAIIGKAYYAGTIDLAEAIREAGAQC